MRYKSHKFPRRHTLTQDAAEADANSINATRIMDLLGGSMEHDPGICADEACCHEAELHDYAGCIKCKCKEFKPRPTEGVN